MNFNDMLSKLRELESNPQKSDTVLTESADTVDTVAEDEVTESEWDLDPMDSELIKSILANNKMMSAYGGEGPSSSVANPSQLLPGETADIRRAMEIALGLDSPVEEEVKEETVEEDLGDVLRLAGMSEAAEKYANTPEEEVEPIDAAVPAGNDLHKKKSAHRAAAGGDNPMAVKEDVAKMEAKLSAMLESMMSKSDEDAEQVDEADGYQLWPGQKKKKFFQAPKDKNGETDIQKWAREKREAEAAKKQQPDEDMDEGIGRAAMQVGKAAVTVPAKAAANLVGGTIAGAAQGIGKGAQTAVKGLGKGAVQLGKGALGAAAQLGKGATRAAGEVGKGALGAAGDVVGGVGKGLKVAGQQTWKDITQAGKDVKAAYRK